MINKTKTRLLTLVFLLLCSTIYTQDRQIVIVYSQNTNGVLENCNCPERSYGGLEKRAAVIDSIRKVEKDIILVDTGDILDIISNPLCHQYVIRGYNYMRYDYWIPGDQDFVEGSDFFFETLCKMSGQLLISNLKYNDKQVGQTYVIKNIGNIRLGITGTIRDDLNKFLEESQKYEFSFGNQMLHLGYVLNEMQGKTDYIILLSHSGIDRDYQISEKFPQIGLIIGGHSQTLLPEPEKAGSTYITQIGESGYRLGIFKLQFKNRQLTSVNTQVILLRKNMKDNPYIMNLIKEYHQKRLSKHHK